ncbi:alkaline-phosphatase-like protein [Cladochytrium replicatum]|nr:alkaline-phosphatase-like protein [Cladochytrium replicatum]
MAAGVALLLLLAATLVAFLRVHRAILPPSKDNGIREVGWDVFGQAVILISLDGFRAEYLQRGLTPNLYRMAKSGVAAKQMSSVFPSVTFPNHYTLVTGLYPESHGMVANVFYDPVLNDTFDYGSVEKNTQGKWWLGEPIWVTLVKQGKKSATCMWPGSEAAIQGIRPTYWLTFDYSMTPNMKVDQILTWLDLPSSQRPHLVTMYTPEIDSAGHRSGVYSKEVNDTLVNVDRALGRLMDELDTRNLTSYVNVIVVSDHGMTDLSHSRVIFMDDYVDFSNDIVQRIDAGSIVGIYPVDEQRVYEAFKNASDAGANAGKRVFWVWKRDEVPAEFHYSNSQRIAPILLVAELGWHFTLRASYDPTKPLVPVGTHGFDPRYDDMKALFVATGPSFEERAEEVDDLELISTASTVVEDGWIPNIENRDIYGLIAKILGVVPAPNNGTKSMEEIFEKFLKIPTAPREDELF